MPYHLPACQWPHILWRQVSCPLYRQNCCGLEHNRGTRSGDLAVHNPSHYATLATAKPLASTHVRQITGRTDTRQALISHSYSRLEPPQHLLHHCTWPPLPVPCTGLPISLAATPMGPRSSPIQSRRASSCSSHLPRWLWCRFSRPVHVRTSVHTRTNTLTPSRSTGLCCIAVQGI